MARFVSLLTPARKLARTGFGKWMIGLVFAKMSFLFPAKRLYESEYVLAFHHPQPCYPVHILIVPKARVEDLLSLHDIELLREIHQAAQCLVREMQLDGKGYRLIVNGGSYQDIPHLHYHLISEEA